MGHLIKRNLEFFGRKYPAWLFVGLLALAGAGAATGIVLSDSIIGSSSVAVSQAILVAAPPIIGGDADEGLGTVEDDGSTFGAHFEANNGDLITIFVPIVNEAGSGQNIVVEFTMALAEGLTMSITPDGTGVYDDVVRTGPITWVFTVDGDAAGGIHGITLTIAIEDAQGPGYYEMRGTFVPRAV